MGQISRFQVVFEHGIEYWGLNKGVHWTGGFLGLGVYRDDEGLSGQFFEFVLAISRG